MGQQSTWRAHALLGVPGVSPSGLPPHEGRDSMRKRLIVLMVPVVAVAASILASTSQGKTTKPDAAVAASGTVTLTGWSVGTTEEALLKQVIAAFQRKYKKIKVKYDAIPNYDQAMLAKFSARKPPDVFYLNSEKASTWISQGLFAPLDKYVSKNNFWTKPFYPRLLSAFKAKGKIYGFPKDWSPLGMEINLDLLGKAGGKAPTTWTQLRSVAQRLKPQMTGTAKPICLDPEWQRALAFVYQNKGNVFTKGKPTFTSAAVRSAMNFYVQLQREGLGEPPAKLGAGWCGEALGKEKAAIAFEGNWAFPYLPDTFPNVRWRFFPMPKSEAQSAK